MSHECKLNVNQFIKILVWRCIPYYSLAIRLCLSMGLWFACTWIKWLDLCEWQARRSNIFFYVLDPSPSFSSFPSMSIEKLTSTRMGHTHWANILPHSERTVGLFTFLCEATELLVGQRKTKRQSLSIQVQMCHCWRQPTTKTTKTTTTTMMIPSESFHLLKI